MPHKGHLACIYNSKAECERARREALGRCTELVPGKNRNADPHVCTNWAQSLVAGRGFCDTHAGKILERELADERRARSKDGLNARIDAALSGQSNRWQETIDWHNEQKEKGLWPYSS